jgi:hypothetical protein
MEWATVQQGPPWAVDSWGLGCMMQVGGGRMLVYLLMSVSSIRLEAVLESGTKPKL